MHSLSTYFDTKSTLEQAQLEAQRKARYFLVYLHSPDHWRSQSFLRQWAADSELQRILADRFHLWAADVDTPAGNEQCTNFGVVAFPCVVVGVKKRFVAKLEGVFTMGDLRRELEKAMEAGAGDIAKEIAFQVDRLEREQVRVEQERALEEAMRHDRARMQAQAEQRAARAREESEARERERLAREEAARAALEAQRAAEEEQRRAEELELRRAQALSAVPPEPAEDCPADEVGQLKFVAAGGAAVTRRFHATTTVNELFAFAESLPSYDASPYQLVTGFPPKPIDRESLGTTQVRDVKGLWPRAVVTVRAL
jgi:FAS-associated factor 2